MDAHNIEVPRLRENKFSPALLRRGGTHYWNRPERPQNATRAARPILASPEVLGGKRPKALTIKDFGPDPALSAPTGYEPLCRAATRFWGKITGLAARIWSKKGCDPWVSETYISVADVCIG